MSEPTPTQHIRVSQRKNFLKILPYNSVGAEIGVYKGSFSVQIKEMVSPKLLYLVDPWWLLKQKRWEWTFNKQSIIDAYIITVKRLADDLTNGKVIIKVDFSQNALASLPDNHLDWVYLDSSHSYENTKKELEILKSKVKKRGLITGHDWQPDPQHRHHGVYKAVREFIENNPGYYLAYLDNHTQWCIKIKTT